MYTVNATLTVPAEDATAAIQRVFDAFMSSDIEPLHAEVDETATLEDEDVAEARSIIHRLEKLEARSMDTDRRDEGRQARDQMYYARVALRKAIELMPD